MKTYSEKLKDPRWQRMRLEVMQRDDFRCRLCSDKDNTLHVHHLRYDRAADPWDYPKESLVTLCADCHEEMHVAKFGDHIVEAVVTGGASIEDLYAFLSVLQQEFNDGPTYAPMTRAQWNNFTDAITAAAQAVRAGLQWEEIVAALTAAKKAKAPPG